MASESEIYQYKGLKKNEVRSVQENLSVALAEITCSARGELMSANMVEKLRFRLSQLTDCLLVYDTAGLILGYGLYDQFEADDDIGTILYEDAKMVRREFQGQGIGTEITRRACQQLVSDFFTTRTQNPAEVRSVQKVLSALTAYNPLDVSHRKLLEILSNRHGETLDVDFSRGTYRPLNGGKRVGDFVVNTELSVINSIENVFSDRLVDRNRGERLYFIAKLD